MDLHALADGRVLVRTSNGNEALDGARISHLAASKATGDYEQEPVPGATRADLDPDVIHDYVQRRIDRLGRDVGEDAEDILTAAGALSLTACPPLPASYCSAKTHRLSSHRAP